MTEEAAQQKHAPAAAAGNTAAAEQQNVPSINNLIHPQPHDGSHHTHHTHHSHPAQTTATTAASSGGNNTHNVQQTQPQQTQIRQTKGKYTLADFELQRTLGTGSFGRVHLVKSNHNQRFYAVKVLKKAQVVKMKQVEHTNDERRMLQEVKHPFLITLWGTFQDSKNLYMVMDFVEGGELFSLLRKSQVGSRNAQRMSNANNITALSQSSCKVLRCRGYAGARISSLEADNLSRPEAGKSSTRPIRPSQDYRLWVCQESPRYNLDSMWNP